MSVVAAEARHSQRLLGPQERAPFRTVKRYPVPWLRNSVSRQTIFPVNYQKGASASRKEAARWVKMCVPCRRLAEWRPRRSSFLGAQGLDPTLISHDIHVSGQQALRLCTALQESHFNE